MKNKLVGILTLAPLLGFAHPGHEHQAVEIIFNPFMWVNHPLFICSVGILVIFVTRRVMKKYFPETFKMISKRFKINKLRPNEIQR